MRRFDSDPRLHTLLLGFCEVFAQNVCVTVSKKTMPAQSRVIRLKSLTIHYEGAIDQLYPPPTNEWKDEATIPNLAAGQACPRHRRGVLHRRHGNRQAHQPSDHREA